MLRKWVSDLQVEGQRFRSCSVILAGIVLDMLDGAQAHLMLCTLLLVRASQIALMASSVNVPTPCQLTPQSWLSFKLRMTHKSGKWIRACIQRVQFAAHFRDCSDE